MPGPVQASAAALLAFATPQVEPELEVFESAHPTLTGAALRLVLPEHAP